MLILITACSQSPTGQVVREETTDVALLLPLTGTLGQYGRDELNAVKLFIEDESLKKNARFDISLEDTSSNSKQAVSAYKKIKLSNPDVMLTIGSAPSLALQPLTNKDELVTFVVGANPDLAKGYMIQNLATSKDYVSGIINELELRGNPSVGILNVNNDFGNAVARQFKMNYDAVLITETFNDGDTSLKTQISKIKNTNSQAIFLVGSGKSLGNAIRQIRELAGNMTIYSTPEINYEDVSEVAGEGFYNIVYSDISADYTSGELKEFRDKYFEKFGSEPSYDSVLAYNAMLIINECAGKDLYACITANEFDILTGTTRIVNNRIDFSESMVVKKI